jgi:hypothetical protein
MFDLNETINWKPKATGKDVLEMVENMPMTGIYRSRFGNSIAYLENRRQPRRNLDWFS